MELIDINAGAGDKPVVAQVTKATGFGEVEQKMRGLEEEEFAQYEFVYMFGPEC